MHLDETIYALSTGAPPAAIAIIRLSGPKASDALMALTGKQPEARVATLAQIRDPQTGELLDRGLILIFPGPHSATGEDLAELHLHGGRAVVEAVKSALAGLDGLREAAPGEFTRRSFEHGRLDLVEAEGLADLLEAETEGQRRNAIALADGTLSKALRRWRDELTMLSAAIEARIDFAEEDDVPENDVVTSAALAPMIAEMEATLAIPPAERLKEGIRVVIAGPPNEGKSTLFNALLGREVAITTPIPGTTRDMIEYPVRLDGLAFTFVDTAGLRQTDDPIEAMGIERTMVALARADILLWLGEPEEAPAASQRIIVQARSDIAERVHVVGRDIAVSAHTGRGMDDLRREIVSRGTRLFPQEHDISLSARHRDAISEIVKILRAGSLESDILLVAEALRLTRGNFDRLLGSQGIEPLFDAIFSRFCIGK